MGKYYKQYEKALNKHGYTVDEHGYVWDAQGNQLAAEDNYGNAWSKDYNINDICRAAEEAKLKNKVKKVVESVKPKKKMVRARNSKGHYIADDPNTPENEAWVEAKD
jgi:hypothetical protein